MFLARKVQTCCLLENCYFFSSTLMAGYNTGLDTVAQGHIAQVFEGLSPSQNRAESLPTRSDYFIWKRSIKLLFSPLPPSYDLWVNQPQNQQPEPFPPPMTRLTTYLPLPPTSGNSNLLMPLLSRKDWKKWYSAQTRRLLARPVFHWLAVITSVLAKIWRQKYVFLFLKKGAGG